MGPRKALLAIAEVALLPGCRKELLLVRRVKYLQWTVFVGSEQSIPKPLFTQ